MTMLKTIAAAGAVAILTTGLAATTAEARNGRNAAFAAGAAVGVLGGAALAGAAYNNNAYYSVPANGCYDPYDCGPYGAGPVETYPSYYAPAPVYRAPPPVVYGDPYGASSGDIARWRFENRK
jgi:hypothetical protein